MTEKKAKKPKQDYLANWKRERADFLNYKKQESERMQRYITIAKEELLMDLLPVLDNMYLAEKELKDDNWSKGFLGIKAQLVDFLKKQGVEEIDCLNKRFDPHFQEAIEEVKGEKPGIVVEVVLRGYILNNKVLRPAKVKVTI